MSDAALTDSTTPSGSLCVTESPTSGSSRYVMSPSSLCAKSARPIVATSPSRRTHSWLLVNRRSLGDAIPVILSSVRVRYGLSLTFVERGLHLHRGNRTVANDDLEWLADPGGVRLDQRQSDVLAQCRRHRAAGDFADAASLGAHLVVRSRRAAALGQLEADRPPRRPRLPHRGNLVASDEVAFVELHRPAESRFQRPDVVGQLLTVERHA